MFVSGGIGGQVHGTHAGSENVGVVVVKIHEVAG